MATFLPHPPSHPHSPPTNPLADPTVVAAPEVEFYRPPEGMSRLEFLCRLRVKELLYAIDKENVQVLVLDATDTVHTALTKLAERNVLSAPVWSDAPDRKGYTLVDVQDLAAAVFQIQSHEWPARRDQFFQMPLLEACNLAHAEQMLVVTLETRVVDLLQRLTRAHRAIVVDDSIPDKHKIVNIVSQFDMLHFLRHYYWAFNLQVNQVRAQEMMRDVTRLAMIEDPSTTTVARALRLCLAERYSGLAIVQPIESNKKLLGNFSVSDLRKFTPEDFWMLWLPVAEYFKLKNRPLPHRSVVCFRDSTFWTVMQRLRERHVHRVYVVDSFNHVQGIISITDILRFVKQIVDRDLQSSSSSQS
jgi:CBS domain containing-hemolysin-like protein